MFLDALDNFEHISKFQEAERPPSPTISLLVELGSTSSN